MSVSCYVAANRFGLGAKSGEIDAIKADPRAWLKAQLAQPPGLPPALAGLPDGASSLATWQKAEKERRDAARPGLLAGILGTPAATPPAPDDPEQQRRRALYLAEAGSRTLAMVTSDHPFIERLVAFWSNHFTVSVLRGGVAAVAGAFEREAIRPHVLGRFGDMLLASTRHPAMLLFLDNAASTGPQSELGRRRDKGLNENLAREVLELHTLGVDGGYDQGDVTQFAAILTGWSIARPNDPAPGTFLFRERLHEPGAKQMLGRRFAESGVEEGEQALAFLAGHPATARHIATRLARHFIADDPPEAAIARLAAVFSRSGGDLGAMAQALIDSPEPWATAMSKVRSPQDYVIAVARACGVTTAPEKLVQAQRQLGQAPFSAPSPAGWPDRAEQWLGSEALLHRIAWSGAIASRIGDGLDPAGLAAGTLGEALSPSTREAILRAPDARTGLTLLLASPEMIRR